VALPLIIVSALAIWTVVVATTIALCVMAARGDRDPSPLLGSGELRTTHGRRCRRIRARGSRLRPVL